MVGAEIFLGVASLYGHELTAFRRVSAIECELEAMEARMSEGQPVDTDVYGRLAGRLCRLLELVGIRRLTKPLDPLSDLAKALEAYPAKAIDDDGDGDENEPMPMEEGLDRTEPGEA